MSTNQYALLANKASGSSSAFTHYSLRMEALPNLQQVISRNETSLLLADGHSTRSKDGSLVTVIGDIFDRGDAMSALMELDNPFCAAMRRSSGRSVLADCWGAYVAFVEHNDCLVTVRDPSGALPCYYAQREGLVMISSSIEPMMQTGFVEPSVDWCAVGRLLVAKDLRPPETCLAGIVELPRGGRLTIGKDSLVVDQIWDPWNFTTPNNYSSAEESAACLKSTVGRCVAARASQFSNILLGVSGGLDSSIVAACLRRAGTNVGCITLATDDPAGDERPFARVLCRYLGLDLVEATEELDYVDIALSHAGHLPRPVSRSFTQSGDRLQRDMADRTGVEAFFSGGGGDNIFCYLTSAAPVADRILRHGPGRAMFRTAVDLARMRGVSVGHAVRKGMVRAWLRKPSYTWPRDFSLLSSDAAYMLEDGLSHPWLDAPPGELPGKAAHVAWLLGIENHLEGYLRERQRPNVFPLLSQPIVELCLGIPSWQWCAGGRDRSVARAAFSDELPREIIERRSKGTPGPFVMQILHAHRAQVRGMLLDGLLASRGLIDTARIDILLSQGIAISEVDNARIMHLLDVEAWARHWSR